MSERMNAPAAGRPRSTDHIYARWDRSGGGTNPHNRRHNFLCCLSRGPGRDRFSQSITDEIDRMLLTHHSSIIINISHHRQTTGIASTSTSLTMAAANLRIAAATPLVLLLLLLLLVLPTTTTAAASSSLRRRQQQQEQQEKQPSQGVEPAAPLAYYPSGLNKGRLTAISPRAASELLQHALLYDDFAGVVTDDGSVCATLGSCCTCWNRRDSFEGTYTPSTQTQRDGGGNDDDEQLLLPAPLGKTEANTTCIMEYCVEAAKACFLERPCRAALQCLSACDTIEDDTPDKIILQNCTAFCVNTYEDAALDAVNGCFDSHGCITLEPIDLPCRDTTEAGALFFFTILAALQEVGGGGTVDWNDRIHTDRRKGNRRHHRHHHRHHHHHHLFLLL